MSESAPGMESNPSIDSTPLLASAARSSATNFRVRSYLRVRQSGSLMGSLRMREDTLSDALLREE